MELIEQAVFTSAQTDRSAGYHLVAASSGVHGIDARELAVWGPSHDSLLSADPTAVSVNFHPLPSGAFCVSRTTSAGWEYSGRGGSRVYTQCLVASPDTLARFANNPFALIRAAMGSGLLKTYDHVPRQLEPMRLVGRAASVDASLLTRLTSSLGVEWMATLVQAALSSVSIAITGGPPAEHVIAGLVNCFPPECRTDLSFSTGLKFSPRRPFRVVALCDNAEERRRVQRLYRLEILNLNLNPPAEFSPLDAWPQFIGRALKSGRTAFMAKKFADDRADFDPQDLPALGLQLLEELDTTSLVPGFPRTADDMRASRGTSHNGHQKKAQRPGPRNAPPNDPPSGQVGRAHQGHRRFEHDGCRDKIDAGRPDKPSALLCPDDRELLDRLEQLDDLVYDAIAGDPSAMDGLRNFWVEIRQDLGEEILAESREQYLAYAMTVWEKAAEPRPIRQPSRAAVALDVLCILFDAV